MSSPSHELPPGAAAAGARAWPRVRPGLLLLGTSLAAVVAIRVAMLAGTDFPINDGALFHEFVVAVAATFPALPDTVGYNGLTLPFAYPPLSFWLAAGGVQLGADPMWIVHRVPVLLNLAYVLLFALLLLRTGHSPAFVAVAVLVFGTSVRSYEWLVMGGGLSRGAGGVLLLLALLALMPGPGERGTVPPWPRLLAGGACVGATVTAHLEWGILAAFAALAALAVTRPGARRWTLAAVAVGLAALAVAAPWFGHVLGTHGLGPFQAASRTSFWGVGVLTGAATAVLHASSAMLPFVVLGVLLAARGRDAFWLAFLVASLVLTPRHGETPMVLALGVLAAHGALASMRWVQARFAGRRGAASTAAVLLLGVLALRTVHSQRPPAGFAPLAGELREAAAWIAAHHPGETFAVMNEADWAYDAVSEWFPVLSQAVAVTTVQGREWLPGRDFDRIERSVDALMRSTSCEAVLEALGSLPATRFVWVEGVDLATRAAVIALAERRRTFAGRVAESIERRLAGATAPKRRTDPGALDGPGTLAGCLQALAWPTVFRNGRVRIFRVP